MFIVIIYLVFCKYVMTICNPHIICRPLRKGIISKNQYANSQCTAVVYQYFHPAKGLASGEGEEVGVRGIMVSGRN